MSIDYRDFRARWEARAVELGVAPIVLGPVAEEAHLDLYDSLR
ncbi:hypothetical protein ACFPJ1_31135 [Kribbella qitaiheensis]